MYKEVHFLAMPSMAVLVEQPQFFCGVAKKQPEASALVGYVLFIVSVAGGIHFFVGNKPQ